jgi:hypothetical protein
MLYGLKPLHPLMLKILSPNGPAMAQGPFQTVNYEELPSRATIPQGQARSCPFLTPADRFIGEQESASRKIGRECFAAVVSLENVILRSQ